jgi:hypothetical protein
MLVQHGTHARSVILDVYQDLAGRITCLVLLKNDIRAEDAFLDCVPARGVIGATWCVKSSTVYVDYIR